MNTLYHYPLSPFSRKVRLCLAEKRIEVALVEEKYWEMSPEFLRRNPAGQVPVLKMNGRNYADSTAICEFLEELSPEPPLMPSDPEGRYEARRLAAWFDGKFYAEVTKKLTGERVMRKVMGAGYPDSGNVKAGARAAKVHLDFMAKLLEERRWLAGNMMTIADFAAAAQVSCLDYTSDFDWNRHEVVKDWYAKIKSRPAFRSILADEVPGFQPAPHYANLDF